MSAYPRTLDDIHSRLANNDASRCFVRPHHYALAAAHAARNVTGDIRNAIAAKRSRTGMTRTSPVPCATNDVPAKAGSIRMLATGSIAMPACSGPSTAQRKPVSDGSASPIRAVPRKDRTRRTVAASVANRSPRRGNPGDRSAARIRRQGNFRFFRHFSLRR